MASRIVLMSPNNKNILGPRNVYQAEKENQEHQSIIVRTPRDRFSSDSDSDGWSAGERKTKKSSADVPHYVTRDDGPQQRRRPRVSALSPTPTSLPSHVIARRNERERNRVRQVNDSFAVLRSHIPEYLYEEETIEGNKGNRKKLSKVETLRLAVHYIQKLEHLLDLKASDTFSDDDRLFGSETQMSSTRDVESEVDSDIMDLSRDQRRSPVEEEEQEVKLAYEEDFVMKSEGDAEVGGGSMSPYSSHGSPTSPPRQQLHLPSISTFPTKGHPLRYSDLYP